MKGCAPGLVLKQREQAVQKKSLFQQASEEMKKKKNDFAVNLYANPINEEKRQSTF